MLFRRFRKNRPFLVAERFVAPAARLSGLVLPLDVIARQPVARLRILVLAEGSAPPELQDCLEDWVSAPVTEHELRARTEALAK